MVIFNYYIFIQKLMNKVKLCKTSYWYSGPQFGHVHLTHLHLLCGDPNTYLHEVSFPPYHFTIPSEMPHYDKDQLILTMVALKSLFSLLSKGNKSAKYLLFRSLLSLVGLPPFI
jgi:hypothetical protein